jgi:plastocyanin
VSSKGKRRREARRRARQRREDRPAERPPLEEDVAAEAGGPEYEESPGREEEAVRSAAEARHSRAARKRAKRRDVGPWERVRSLRVPPWLIVTPVLVIGVGVLAYLILSSGSSGVTGGGITELTPDPRVAGLTPDDTVSVNVNDVNFSSTEISGNAGDVIEILVTNTGTISHNMVVAGLDDEYDTADDFEPQPFAIQPGETGRLVVKLDPPDAYRFRCAFHPTIEFGTLTLE